MFSSVLSGAVHGVQSYLLRIETDISDGLPTFSMVGFVSAQVREAQERVRVALKNTGIHLPPRRITVNFSPAEIPKRDLIADLPVAVGLLEAMEEIDSDAAEGILILGGLSLDAELTPVRGVLPIVRGALEEGIDTVLLPVENAREAAALGAVKVIGLRNLEEVISYLRLARNERDVIYPPHPAESFLQMTANESAAEPDYCSVSGQDGVKRALEIAAAGFHNVLMIGPPGSGKSMMAKCLPGILPPLTKEECLEVSAIYSIAGELKPEKPLIHMRPFMAPHHSITQQALVGGGVNPKPGMISLAHRGVLFMDELPEFGRENLNLLRQPLEDQHIVISRSTGNYDFPARFMFVAATNPCPCGYYPDSKCNCTRAEILRYQGRMPGPILDRIDLTVDAPRVPVESLLQRKEAEPSSAIRRRVMAAHEQQKERFAKESICFNAEMNAMQTEQYCELGRREKFFVKEIFQKMNLSARAYHRILKTARTIADLDGCERVNEDHLAEAVGYRCVDRGQPGKEGMLSQ